jgi:hypothetical protein
MELVPAQRGIAPVPRLTAIIKGDHRLDRNAGIWLLRP